MKNLQITQWCHRFITEQVQPGDLCIDATMGKGNDTLLLCQLAGSSGTVLAFDIQEEALVQTRKRLIEASAPKNYQLYLMSHIHMDQYAKEGSVSCIVFNFGYLPGGDHKIATLADTSLTAISQGLSLLKTGGLMSLCIYSGGDSGYEEKEAILSFVSLLDPQKYLVIRTEYANRPGDPPTPVLIVKL